jgi:asparagine synthase (glutamine-hydrolysing)
LHCVPEGVYHNYSLLAMAAKTKLEQMRSMSVDRPQFIWSGDGGSVGLGHVYMTEQMLEIGDLDGLVPMIREFMTFNRQNFPVGVLRTAARKRLQDDLFESVKLEVNRYPVNDLGRRLYLFLLFNDQRRHLFKHFETIDQHGLELLTPFYDARFLSLVIATPARWGVLHRLYAGFFEHLPEFALKTPWQTYPGHVPCPLPPDENSRYQWLKPAPLRQLGLIERTRLSIGMLRATDYKSQLPVFSITRIWMAAILHMLGIRDCRHILPALQAYQRHEMIARTN